MIDYLSGKARIEDIICLDEKYDNLFFVGAGALVDGGFWITGKQQG